MDVNQIGRISEVGVLSQVMNLGYAVSIPFGDKEKYDQIWDVEGKLIRVQVKTARWKDDSHRAILFNCYSVTNGKKHKYSVSEIDYFATYWDGQCYVVPVEECSSEKVLWFDKPSNGCKVSMAEDYKLERIIQNI